MDVVRFILQADPDRSVRLGARLDDAEEVVDLQAAHVAMRGVPSPWLRDARVFVDGGDAARATCRAVVDWVSSERAPGTTVPLDAVRVLEPVWRGTPSGPRTRSPF